MARHAVDDDTLLSTRNRVLSPSYRLFYEEPLHPVRGEGVWLYEADGRRYLDAYNNVPVAGHCHPYIVEQVAKQASVLNIHTRYLTELPVLVAERLLATMPADMGCVILTNSGSEANDLAIRMSRMVTGGTGVIVTDCAYHGTSDLLQGMSPVTGLPLGKDVFTIRLPLEMSDPATFTNLVHDALDRMHDAGVKPAALLVDTNFGSDDWRGRADKMGSIKLFDTLFGPEFFPRNLRVVEDLKGLAVRHGRSLPQLALRWAISNPAVSTALVGCRTVAEVEDNVGALSWAMTESEVAEIDAAFARHEVNPVPERWVEDA